MIYGGAGFHFRKSVAWCASFKKELGRRLVQTVRAADECHLLTDGRHIYLEDSARGVVNLLKNSQQPMLTVCLSDTIERVCGELGDAKKRSAGVRHLTARSKAS